MQPTFTLDINRAARFIRITTKDSRPRLNWSIHEMTVSTGIPQATLDAVKNRTMTVAPAEVSHRVTSVGHLGQVAMFTGRTIKWDYTTEHIIGDPIANAMLGRESRAPWKLEGKV
ncbi:MAG: hypothetical protein WCK89_15785 [bacterium]